MQKIQLLKYSAVVRLESVNQCIKYKLGYLKSSLR